MAELSLSLPVKGEEAPGADAKVNAAFTEIQTQFNGKIENVNLAANNTLIKTNGKYETKSATKAEANAGLEFNATRPVLITTKKGAFSGAVEIGGVSSPPPSGNGQIWVPPAQKIKGELTEATIEFWVLTL